MIQPSKKTYVNNYAALMVLLALTAGLSFIDLGIFNTVAALLIPFTKMVLIILFFMHVRYSSRMIWIASVAGFFWLAILLVMAMSDYLSRGW